jgi:hypothetical protein
MNNAPPAYVSLDAASGSLYLRSSLIGTTYTNLTYSITAAYGLLVSKSPLLLEVTVSDTNEHAPVFDSHVYSVQVNESMPVGTELLRMQAQDVDSPVLSYFIVDGDPTGRFILDSLTGIPHHKT